MSAVELKSSGSGVVSVIGTLSFKNVTSVFNESMMFFDGKLVLKFDLQAVDKSDSAGLALLVEWLSLATENDQQISFVNLPGQMLDIAHVSGLDKVLPIV